MEPYQGYSREQLQERKEKLLSNYDAFKSQGLKLDMSRGKPCTEQLELSHGLFEDMHDFISVDGTDVRNYGALDGIKEAKAYFGEIFNLADEQIFIGGNSSLNLMYDLISKAYIHGLNGFEKPWSKLDKVKFLCPCPGYDRHFAITQLFGAEMIIIPMDQNGPDMDKVEALVADDDSIKGIWCVPKYSNPSGITYSDNVVRRLAAMKTKAPDFTIIWDNAYAIHHLYEKGDELLDLLVECSKAGNPNRAYLFSSTSKVTFPGAGISFMASSKENMAFIKKQITIQTIGHDKINMLQHVRFLKDAAHTAEHMKKHAEIIRPKFEAVNEILSKNLEGKGIAAWNNPNGGYFISLDVMPGCAKRTVTLAKEAGVTLTSAGATYPYGKDPDDANIRIAPTYPPVEELRKAIEILSICVELSALEKMLAA